MGGLFGLVVYGTLLSPVRLEFFLVQKYLIVQQPTKSCWANLIEVKAIWTEEVGDIIEMIPHIRERNLLVLTEMFQSVIDGWRLPVEASEGVDSRENPGDNDVGWLFLVAADHSAVVR